MFNQPIDEIDQPPPFRIEFSIDEHASALIRLANGTQLKQLIESQPRVYELDPDYLFSYDSGAADLLIAANSSLTPDDYKEGRFVAGSTFALIYEPLTEIFTVIAPSQAFDPDEEDLLSPENNPRINWGHLKQLVSAIKSGEYRDRRIFLVQSPVIVDTLKNQQFDQTEFPIGQEG